MELILNHIVTVFGDTNVAGHTVTATNCQFNENFGPFKAGQEVNKLFLVFMEEKGWFSLRVGKRAVTFRMAFAIDTPKVV